MYLPNLVAHTTRRQDQASRVTLCLGFVLCLFFYRSITGPSTQCGCCCQCICSSRLLVFFLFVHKDAQMRCSGARRQCSRREQSCFFESIDGRTPPGEYGVLSPLLLFFFPSIAAPVFRGLARASNEHFRRLWFNLAKPCPPSVCRLPCPQEL